MPNLPVLAGNMLDPGMRAEAVNTYAQQYKGIADQLGGVMDFAVPSDKLTEIRGYWTTPAYASRWQRGQERKREGFDSVKFYVTNHEWSAGTRWHKNDEQDDQTHSLVSHARQVGMRAANIMERVFFQLLTATTDPDLLPNVPNAPDGAAFFATTAGGSARFGKTNGNLLTGSGVSTGSLILADFYSTRAQLRGFKDTKSQPLLDVAAIDDGIYNIWYNSDNDLVFRQAFEQRGAVVVVKNAAATENVAAAVPTNIIMDTGVKVRLRPTQRITDNDWFTILEHPSIPIKPVVQQSRWPMTERIETMENSDRARDTGFVGFDFDWRETYYINLPYSAVKTNN